MIPLKSPLRVSLWPESTALALPPQVCITRWDTWINGAIWYSEPAHFNTFVQVVNELDPHDAQSIEDCQEVLGSPTLKTDLQFIADHFSFLPPLLHQMEESDVGLVRGLSLFEEAEAKILQVPGPKGNILREKFEAVKQRNPDLQMMKDIRDKIVATHYMPDMRD